MLHARAGRVLVDRRGESAIRTIGLWLLVIRDWAGALE